MLDLCAGSGALGLEALSRGAAHVLLVESDRRAAAVLRRNVAAVDLPGAQVRAAPAAAVLAGQADRAFDLLLVDPPYATPDTEVAAWLTAALAHGWLAADATVVVERPSRGGPFPWPAPLQPVRERRYGETTLHLARCYRPSSRGAPSAPAPSTRPPTGTSTSSVARRRCSTRSSWRCS